MSSSLTVYHSAELLFISIHKLLDLYQGRIRMPSIDEFQAQVQALKTTRAQQQQQSTSSSSSSDQKIKTTFKNTFVITKPLET